MSRNNRFESSFDSVETFESFFHGWLIRQEHYLHELLQCVERINRNQEVEENECREIIARVLAHYKQYYAAKSRLARENVFLVLSPTWFSSFERSFFWIAGFKPRLVLQLAAGNLSDLAKEQQRRLEELAAETGEGERELEEVLARVQERLAVPVVVEAARTAVNGEGNQVELAIEKLRLAMEEILECADCLRLKTVLKVMKVLSAAQTVRLLAAFAHFDHTLRSRGMPRDLDHQR